MKFQTSSARISVYVLKFFELKHFETLKHKLVFNRTFQVWLKFINILRQIKLITWQGKHGDYYKGKEGVKMQESTQGGK